MLVGVPCQEVIIILPTGTSNALIRLILWNQEKLRRAQTFKLLEAKTLFFGFYFQVNEVSLSRRISSSIKGAIFLRKDKRSDQSIAGYNGSTKTTSTGFDDDDLEMVKLASKADKSVIDDATVDFVGHYKRGTIADSLDKASRVLFPLSFITFNIVYWIYFSLFG